MRTASATVLLVVGFWLLSRTYAADEQAGALPGGHVALLEDLQRERPEVPVVMRDVGTDSAALARLKDLAAQQGVQAVGVPAFLIAGELVSGYVSDATIGARLKALLDTAQGRREEEAEVEGVGSPEVARPCPPERTGLTAETETIEVPLFGRFSARTVGFPVLTLLVGLVDGVNPCAMWVLVFLLSLLVNLRDRRKMGVIGGTFVLVSGLVYVAFLAAWLNVFLLIGFSRVTQGVLGGVAPLL